MQMLADGYFYSFWKLVNGRIHLIRHARSDLLLKPLRPAGHYNECKFQCSTAADIPFFLVFSEGQGLGLCKPLPCPFHPSSSPLCVPALHHGCSWGHAKTQFGAWPALHWKVMVFTELSYDQLFADSLWHTDGAEHRMLLSKSNDTRSVTVWRNICH